MPIDETILKYLPFTIFIVFIILILLIVLIWQLNKGAKCLPSISSEYFLNGFKDSIVQTPTNQPITTPSPLLNFTKQTQYNFPKATKIQNYSSVTSNQCAQYCSNNPDCDMFVITNNTTKNNCSLKKNTTTSGNTDTNKDVYFKNTSVLTSNYTPSLGTDYTNIINNYKISDPNQCAQYCSADPNCSFFAVETDSTPNCWIFNNTKPSNITTVNKNTYFKNIPTTMPPTIPPLQPLNPNLIYIAGYMNSNSTAYLYTFDGKNYSSTGFNLNTLSGPNGDSNYFLSLFTSNNFMGIINNFAYYYDPNTPSIVYKLGSNGVNTISITQTNMPTLRPDLPYINSIYMGTYNNISYFYSYQHNPIYQFNGTDFSKTTISKPTDANIFYDSITPSKSYCSGSQQSNYFTTTNPVDCQSASLYLMYMGSINNIGYLYSVRTSCLTPIKYLYSFNPLSTGTEFKNLTSSINIGSAPITTLSAPNSIYCANGVLYYLTVDLTHYGSQSKIAYIPPVVNSTSNISNNSSLVSFQYFDPSNNSAIFGYPNIPNLAAAPSPTSPYTMLNTVPVSLYNAIINSTPSTSPLGYRLPIIGTIGSNTFLNISGQIHIISVLKNISGTISPYNVGDSLSNSLWVAPAFDFPQNTSPSILQFGSTFPFGQPGTNYTIIGR